MSLILPVKEKKILLYGAGGHAKVILEIAETLSRPIAGIIDTNTEIRELLGYPVYREFEDLSLSHGSNCIISIGNNKIRKRLSHELRTEWTTLVHPSVNISKRSTVGEGTVVMAGVSVNSCVSIGSHCILNTNSSIDHDCNIANYVHISPNATLAGGVTVGEGSHVGIGASVIQGIKIGKWCTIGAGAVIIRDVPDYCVVVGNPGRVIK